VDLKCTKCALSILPQTYSGIRAEGKGASERIAMKLPEDVYRLHAVTSTLLSRGKSLTRTAF
jgi:hypothetical protein